jgi:hypothetical protein
LESIYNALAAKGITPASESLSDILTAINTIVVPSGKYTYPSGSTGGDVDVTNYAQVNATNGWLYHTFCPDENYTLVIHNNYTSAINQKLCSRLFFY